MKTIAEKNRMIAEFIGHEEEQTESGEFVYAIEFQNSEKLNDIQIEFFYANELKYHTSWDWLMPVIKEISNKTGYVYVMYDTDSYFTNMGDSFYFGGGFESIEQTHIAVVEFIEWYNENK